MSTADYLYTGERRDPRNIVLVNGPDGSHDLPPRTDIKWHSNDLEWGYEGAGPSQLALALMVSEYGDDLSLHPCHYQYLKHRLVARFGDQWRVSSSEIRDWVNLIARSSAGDVPHD